MSKVKICNLCGVIERKMKVEYCAYCGGSSFRIIPSEVKVVNNAEKVEETSPIVLNVEYDDEEMEYAPDVTPKWYAILYLIPAILMIVGIIMGAINR